MDTQAFQHWLAKLSQLRPAKETRFVRPFSRQSQPVASATSFQRYVSARIARRQQAGWPPGAGVAGCAATAAGSACTPVTR